MPVSQSRIIALINSALDYKQAAERLRDSIQHAFDAANSNKSQSFSLLTDLLSYSNFEPSLKPDTLATLTVEYHHFRRNARRNERAAQKETFRRRSAGVIPRSVTPRDTHLTNSTSLPPVGILQRQQFQSSTIYTIADAERERAAYLADHPEAADAICPHCHATDLADCKLNEIDCQWHSEILKQQKAEAEQDDFSHL